jgi:subtilisin family serine protease
MNKSFALIGLLVLALFFTMGWGQHNQATASSESIANTDSAFREIRGDQYPSAEPLPARSGTGIEIRLQQAVFDPLQGPPALPPQLTTEVQEATPGSNYYLVQFEGPIQTAWRADIERQGGTIMDYVPDFAYIVKMDEEQLTQVQTTAAVRWVGLYQPAFRLSNQLIAGLADAQADVAVDLVLRAFAGEPAAELLSELAALGAEVSGQAADTGGGLIYRVRVPETAVADLAHIPAIAWIEPYIEPGLHNEIARSNLAMNQDEVEQVLGLYGQNQMVAVGDTGLSTGNPATVHQDFDGRVVGGTWGPGTCGTWADNHSHGTHVAGSVLGSGFHSGADIPNQIYTGSNAGIAPEALLYVWSFCNNFSGLPNAPYANYYGVMYGIDSRLRINTNSWGYTSGHGQYNTFTRETDRFVWDHPDMVLLYAAGNDGTDGNSDGVVDVHSMNMPATGKNVITVGASENYRLTGGLNPGGPCSTWGTCWPADYPANPINSDMLSDNVDGMAAFSGRGPVLDGRLKPDLVAPGTNIVSARNESVGMGWGIYDDYYLYMGGTSMATPLVAGAAAIVREFYTTTYGIDPSAALVKATLITGAYDMTPGQYGVGPTQDVTGRPDNNQGWGRVDLPNTLIYDAGRTLWYYEHAGLNTGGSYQVTFEVTDETIPFQATLVWVDHPGTEASHGALVNDLDLEVEAPNGTVYLGNEILTGGLPDRTNNVEVVDLLTPLSGTYTVTVSGFNIPQGPQPFALVVTALSDLALLEGTVQSMGYCDENPFAAAGAQVEVTSGAESWTVTANANGNYYLYLDESYSPVDIEVTAADHESGSATGVVLVNQQTTTVDFDLRLLEPCASVNPESFDVELVVDSVAIDTLSINNTGGGVLDWDIEEAEPEANMTRSDDPLRVVPDELPLPVDLMRDYDAFPLADVIQDGGFEAGTPNPFWDEFSSTFGTPLCTAASCGTGGGTGSNSGSWWAWFGGINAAETGYVRQMVTLDAGAAELSFWLEIPASSGTGNDFMTVSLGGTEIFSVTDADAGDYPTYTEVVIDVSAFAGGTHELSFDSSVFGGGTTNFFIDDVALDSQPVMGGCAAPTDVPWLSVVPDSGSTPAGESDDVTVTFDATGLAIGTYEALLCVNSNDPANPLLEVPVTLTVVEQEEFILYLPFVIRE